MIMINLFVGIICDTMAGVAEDEDVVEDEIDVAPVLLNAVINATTNRRMLQRLSRFLLRNFILSYLSQYVWYLLCSLII